MINQVLELTAPKDILLMIEDWNAKVGSQETPGITQGLQIWPWSTK